MPQIQDQLHLIYNQPEDDDAMGLSAHVSDTTVIIQTYSDEAQWQEGAEYIELSRAQFDAIVAAYQQPRDAQGGTSDQAPQ